MNTDDKSMNEPITQAQPSRPTGHKVTVPVNRVVVALMVVAIAGVGFGAGAAFQDHHDNKTSNRMMRGGAFGQAGGMGGPGRFGGRQQNGALGSVTAISDTSITITTRRDTSKTYKIDSSTKITSDGATVAVNTIKSGDNVLIQTSSSSSDTATSIVVNPNFGPPSGDPSADSGSTTTN
jgi:hypothetical protein